MQAAVEGLYRGYITKINNAMNATGEGVAGEYEGAVRPLPVLLQDAKGEANKGEVTQVRSRKSAL